MSVQQHPKVVTAEARIAAEAIREMARAMPVYHRTGEPAKYDGDDVREFMLEYADTLVTPITHSRRPSR